jgi:hypothetical protein
MSVAPKPAVKTKKSTRVVEKKTEKIAPAQKTTDPATEAAAAIAASGTTGSNPAPPADGGPPPAEAAANPAPPPPAEPLASTASETKTEVRSGGPWVVLGVLIAAGVGIYLLMSRRRREESLSIYNREATPTVERVTTTTVKSTTRPGPPITHNP